MGATVLPPSLVAFGVEASRPLNHLPAAIVGLKLAGSPTHGLGQQDMRGLLHFWIASMRVITNRRNDRRVKRAGTHHLLDDRQRQFGINGFGPVHAATVADACNRV